MTFERFLAAVDAASDIAPHALVVWRDGVELLRHAWTPWRADDPVLVYSVSKTLTGTAVGFALAEGLVGLADRVVDLFPDEARGAGPRARALTVEHLLTMTTGHVQDPIWEVMAGPREHLVATFLSLEPAVPPGRLHCYNNAASWVLGEVIRRRAGLDLLDYLRPRLLDPLGVDATWDADPQGRQFGSTGIHLSTVGLARLAELYRCDGRWRGRRVLPEGWVRQATRRHAGTVNEKADWRHGYGYHLWLGREGYRFEGLFGQHALVLPERRAVIAITAAQPRQQHVMELIHELLLPDLAGATPRAGGATTSGRLPAPADLGGGGTWSSARLVVDEALAGWPDASFDATRPRSGSQYLLPILDAVRVARHGAGWRLDLDAEGGPWAAQTSRPGWERTLLRGADGVAVPVALAGGADAAGAVRLDVAFIQTPHVLHLELGGAVDRLAWNVSPPQGSWNTPARTLLADLRA